MRTLTKLTLLAGGALMMMAPNRRPHDHIGSFNFKVEIEGVTVGAFTEVAGLDSYTDVVVYQDGDDIIERKRPGRTHYSNIVLERGYINTDELWNWRKKVIEGKVERKSGSIILGADDGSEIMRYNYFEAWPAKWSGFNLRGDKSAVTVEKIELAIEKLERG